MGDERTLTSSSTKREPRHIRTATHTRKDVASHTVSGSKPTHSTRTSLAICVARSCSRSSCGPSARSWFSRATAPSRCCKIVMLEQHQPQPLRASARSHARGGRSGSAQSRQPAAAEAPDTHTRCVSWGWVSRGGMIMAVVQARVLAGDSPRWWDATALIRRAQALRVRP